MNYKIYSRITRISGHVRRGLNYNRFIIRLHVGTGACYLKNCSLCDLFILLYRLLYTQPFSTFITKCCPERTSPARSRALSILPGGCLFWRTFDTGGEIKVNQTQLTRSMFNPTCPKNVPLFPRTRAEFARSIQIQAQMF